METRAHYVAVGAFVLAIIVLGFVAVLSLGRVEFAQELKRYYIFFKGSVTGLSKGAFVQYNGITVGRVVDVRVDPDDLEKIQVTVEIDTNLVNIKTDARAFVDTNLLSGVATIQIRGGTREARNLEAQMHLAMEGVRKAVLRLLQDGEAHPQLVVLAVARVVGELGAGIAQAGDMDLETILVDVTEVVRKAGRSHHELLQAEALPVAGNA